MKEKCINKECLFCQNDCVDFKESNCENFHVGKSIKEYLDIIHSENRNVHKICEKHSLKYHTMIDMLNNKKRLSYKYRKCLEEELYEKDEWIDWINNGSHTLEENIDER